MSMSLILRQFTNGGSSGAESRAAGLAGLLGGIEVRNVGIDVLSKYSAQLRSGEALPVGSVEYVREAMRAANVPEPANISYPGCLNQFLYRELHMVRAGSVIGRWFVKPTTVKRFSGFIFDTMQNPLALSAHEREQHEAFMSIPADEMVWISEPVQFLCEWRCYVANGQVIGAARYDPDGAEEAPKPDRNVLAIMVSLLSADPSFDACAYSIDLGVLPTGETALVECNDGWALGLYSRSLDAESYVRMLSARWQQLVSKR